MGKKKNLQEAISYEELMYIEEKKSGGAKFEYLDAFKNQLKMQTSIKVDIKCKNDKQKEYWKALKDTTKKIVIGHGSAGTGKSYLAFAYALKAYKNNDYKNVKILVPTCEASSKLSIGLLPGTIDEKIAPYKECSIYNMAKILEQNGCYDAKRMVTDLVASGNFSFELVSYIRGKTFDDTLLLIEESENLSPEEMLLIITRIGENSKLIISGDPRQADRKYPNNESGLEHAIDKLSEMEEVASIKFEDNDVVRNNLITKILKAW